MGDVDQPCPVLARLLRLAPVFLLLLVCGCDTVNTWWEKRQPSYELALFRLPDETDRASRKPLAELQDFTGRTTVVAATPLLTSARILTVEPVTEANGEIRALRIKPDDRGRHFWMEACTSYPDSNLVIVVDGWVHGLVRARANEAANRSILLPGPWGQAEVAEITSHAENNYRYYNPR